MACFIATQGVFFTSTNEDRVTTVDVPMLTQNDILNLPKGQAFCLLEGGKLFKLRMPLPKRSRDDVLDSIEEIVKKMRTQS